MRGDDHGWPATVAADVGDRDVAVRIPLPDLVRAAIETEQHPLGGSCLLLRYKRLEEHSLVATLEEGIAAIRRGPAS